MGDGLGDGVVGDPPGDVDEDGETDPGAGPSDWAPPSAHAAVIAARVIAIAIRRFVGCLLLPGTRPMLGVGRNTGTPRASRFRNSVGQSEREPGTRPGLAPDLDVTAEQPRVLASDREPEAAAGPRARRFRSVEAIEDMRKVLRRDPAAGVGDLNERTLAVNAGSDHDLIPAVLERVADQVGHDPIDA
jgi:hypothetical protein